MNIIPIHNISKTSTFEDYIEFFNNSIHDRIPRLSFSYLMTVSGQDFDCCNRINDIDVEIHYPYDIPSIIHRMPQTLIGTIHLNLINLKAYIDKGRLVSNASTKECHCDLFEEILDYGTNQYRDLWKNILADQESKNILFLKSLFLQKDFRRFDVGRAIFNELQHRFYGMFGLLATESIPMQFRENLPHGNGWDWDDMEKDSVRAGKMYREFLERSGFTQHKDSSLYYSIGATT